MSFQNVFSLVPIMANGLDICHIGSFGSSTRCSLLSRLFFRNSFNGKNLTLMSSSFHLIGILYESHWLNTIFIFSVRYHSLETILFFSLAFSDIVLSILVNTLSTSLSTIPLWYIISLACSRIAGSEYIF